MAAVRTSIAVVAAVLSGGALDRAHADGVPSAAVSPPARIRNGQPTFDFPAVGVLSADNTLCTGTLIGCHTVLTAGHCVCRDHTDSCVPSGQVAPEHVRVFFQHAGFAAASTINAAIGAVDLALITLAEPITGIVPARLDRNLPAPGSTAAIAGFGTEEFIDMAPQGVGIKRSASVRLASCGNDLLDILYLCANVSSAADPGVCPGDSGGPLLVDRGAGPMVAGVAAFITGDNNPAECNPPFTEFFTGMLAWRAAIETAARGDVSGVPCSDLEAVGSAHVTVYPFTGELSSSADEVGGDFEVPPGVAVLRVTMNGALLTGQEQNNFDLFVSHEGDCSATCSDTSASAFGACEIPSPTAGSWHVRARRVQGEGEVQVTATLFGAGGGALASAAPGPRIGDWQPGDPHEIDASYGDGTTAPYVDGRLEDTGQGDAPRIAVLHQLDASAQCIGDCDGCGSVSVDELVRLVNIALGATPVTTCPGIGVQGPVTIDVLIQAVNAALSGCTAA